MGVMNKLRNDAQSTQAGISAEAAYQWLVVSMLHDPRLLEVRDGYSRRIPEAATAELESHGCNRTTLLNTIACGRRLSGLLPPITARKLRRLTTDCDKLREAMIELSQPAPRVWATGLVFDEEDRQVSIDTSADPARCSWYCDSQLAADLLSKAAGYRELAKMCQARRLPTRANIARFGYIWPVVYVNACCGEPHFREVARLLQLTGQRKTEQQLRATFNELRSEQSWILDWLKNATSYLEATVKEAADIQILPYKSETSVELKALIESLLHVSQATCREKKWQHANKSTPDRVPALLPGPRP